MADAASPQAYYWTPEWQANEAVASEEIRAGKVRVFPTADGAIRWLLSEDDDGS